ncbi:hypothetical protein SCOCK_130082 [Actinacidiphila cocklensis]|uniref:Uncharacterized protein n=1 Tax=Actinacidiphila cocklensis TaxID=887465 RepID=A0A9W4GNT8_9ACTN|nr:hypothetical protein SCOCK_130082 [Actinacidiphila cocklensis]
MCPAHSMVKPEAASRVGGRASQEPHAARLQVLRLGDDAALRTRNHLRRRPQRIGQVQCGRRAVLGHG